MAFSTTGLVNNTCSRHGVLYCRPSQHARDHIMAFSTTGLVNTHARDHIMAFSTTGLVNTHVITSWRSLLQA